MMRLYHYIADKDGTYYIYVVSVSNAKQADKLLKLSVRRGDYCALKSRASQLFVRRLTQSVYNETKHIVSALAIKASVLIRCLMTDNLPRASPCQFDQLLHHYALTDELLQLDIIYQRNIAQYNVPTRSRIKPKVLKL